MTDGRVRLEIIAIVLVACGGADEAIPTDAATTDAATTDAATTDASTDGANDAALDAPTVRYGLDFDGLDDVLASTAPLARGLTSTWTAEYWLRREGTTWMKLLSIHNADNRDVDMELRADGFVYCTLFDQAGANHGATSTSVVAMGVWTHVACSYDGTTQRVFVNGVMERETAWQGMIRLDDRISISGFEARFIDGTIDEFRLSSSARYTASFTPPNHVTPDVSTIAVWHLDEGSGTIVHDGSTGGFDAVLAGSSASPTWVTVTR